MNLHDPRMGPAERDFWFHLDEHLAELEMKEKEKGNDGLRSVDESIDQGSEDCKPGT